MYGKVFKIGGIDKKRTIPVLFRNSNDEVWLHVFLLAHHPFHAYVLGLPVMDELHNLLSSAHCEFGKQYSENTFQTLIIRQWCPKSLVIDVGKYFIPIQSIERSLRMPYSWIDYPQCEIKNKPTIKE